MQNRIGVIMLKVLWEKVINRQETRKSLIEFRAEYKKSGENHFEAEQLAGRDLSVLTDLLHSEDAKVRKNCALILGELSRKEAEEALFMAYDREQQLFVRPAYLTALKLLESTHYISTFREILSRLEAEDSKEEPDNEEVQSDTHKHRAEERKLLRELSTQDKEQVLHHFTGYKIPAELVLLTNRNHIRVTSGQIKKARYKEFNAGVKIQSAAPAEILPIRTYDEMLFVVPGMGSCPMEAAAAAEVITGSSLMEFLNQNHKERNLPFRFRLELKGVLDQEKKGRFLRTLADELERRTKFQLLNSTGDYEIEIRLIESKGEKYNLLVKLFTIPDERFTYRRESVAASIRPVNAALVCALVQEYLHEDAQILDPFCGVGTMLIERAKLMDTGTMYGIDIFSEAIEKARRNTKEAELHINYINRDFYDFHHEYLFDEVITDMPFTMQKEGSGNPQAMIDIDRIYRKFFIKIKEHLKADGIIIIYTHNKELVQRYGGKKPFRIEREYEISMREKTYVYVLRFCDPA